MAIKFIFAGLVATLLAFATPSLAQGVGSPAPTMVDVNAAIDADASRPAGAPSTLAADLADILVANPALADQIVAILANLSPEQQQAVAQAFALAYVALGDGTGIETAGQSMLNNAAATNTAFNEAYASERAIALAAAGGGGSGGVGGGGPGGGIGGFGAGGGGGGGGCVSCDQPT